MYADLEFAVHIPPGLVVTKEAVIDSGLLKTVYVDRGNGYFEPRTVETGWRLGDRVQILKGLEAGERIVVSGNFLVDSESRMALSRDRHD
jgi:Cu(I)/Ag(I) efflux system membrane fusion protein